MLIAENEVYVHSESFSLSETTRNIYYSNLNKSTMAALVDALKNSEVKSIAALVFVKGVMYLASKGYSSIKIIRNNTTTTLLKSIDNNIVTASGFPKVGDIMLLELTKIPNNMLRLEFEEPKVSIKPSFDLKAFIKNLALKLPKKPIYIREGFTEEVSPQSKKLTFSIALILLVLLAVSIGFGIRQKGINDLKGKYQGILTEASSEVDQAISLASVDSERSRQLFLDSQEKISQIEKLDVKDSKLDSLRQKINESRAAILGEYQGAPEMFLDLGLLSSGFKGDMITFSEGQIYVMDTTGKRIVSVNAATKKSKVVAGPSVINSAASLASYADKVFVLEADGVYEVDSGNQKVIDKSWSGEAFITAFAGNLYVLDKMGNMIYRYQGVGGSFGEKQNWLSPGTNVDFSNVSQIAIDGAIYALFPNSKILKFNQGSPLNFNVKGAVPEIGNINAITGSPDNQYVYLLDTAGGRIVVTDKKGVYKAQYVDQAISQTVNLVVSEADKRIILLTGDKLYSIEIKHL